MPSYLKLAKEGAQEPTRVGRWASRAQEITRQLALVDSTTSRLLGIEQSSRRGLQEHRLKLQQELARLRGRAVFGPRYPRLSLDPLTWRDKRGYPRLVPFSPDDPMFRIFPGYTTPSLPQPIRACYQDVMDLLEKKESRRDWDYSYELSAEFSGLIPAPVRDTILAVRSEFENMFIVAEPKNWALSRAAKVDPDPLVVGWDGRDLWLVADFDTTTVEESMVFTPPAEGEE